MADKKMDTSFPFVKAENYNDFDEIADVFPHLKNINQNAKIDYTQIKNARCFVIRSNTDDDVHKAIKYGVWTSTPKNSTKLSEAFVECQKEGTFVFLFFSVVKSGQFEGIAKLTSELQQINFPYQGKWKSLFTIEWIYIKDVAYKNLDGIFNVDDMIVTRSRDGTEVKWEEDGKKMFQVFAELNTNENIFQAFAELDEREQQLRDQKFAPQKHHNRYYQQPEMNQMQQQYMQMMNMMMYQQMLWQQQMYYQPQFMQQQQYPQYFQQQQQQLAQQGVPQQSENLEANQNPNMQNFQAQNPEQIQQNQN